MDKVEKEIMLIAQEECAEVVQAISKVFRFGVTEEYNGQTNKQRLEEEVGDLLCMIELMMENNSINEANVSGASLRKRLKLGKWSSIFKEETV